MSATAANGMNFRAWTGISAKISTALSDSRNSRWRQIRALAAMRVQYRGFLREYPQHIGWRY